MIALVAGAGGFIGGHVARTLLAHGVAVRAVDRKPVVQWHQLHREADNRVLDLADSAGCREAVAGCGRVYNFAADMGGMGFIESHKAACMLSVLINTHLLVAARDAAVDRYFFASSACVYPSGRQRDADATALAEADAYPADPEDGYGWEKLFSERMCRHFREDFGLATRVARYHNVYGPLGAWEGGREKAPAAICRKIAVAKATGRHEIDIWGDGGQTRSFMYIDDCVAGTLRLADSDVAEPLNVGSDELVTVDALVTLVEDIAGIRVERRYLPDAPVGVRGRNSDNTMIRERLGWSPGIRLADGMERTYRWISDQVAAAAARG
ncbi:GDP-D-mannose 3', 5'-epimerase [Burkholderiales bacterium]|nr:GDP-D-mannose 3', 5'-epimerase [Burkholderiales bacterium]